MTFQQWLDLRDSLAEGRRLGEHPESVQREKGYLAIATVSLVEVCPLEWSTP